MYYVEHMIRDDSAVRVTVYSEQVVNGAIFRDYRNATPGHPLTKKLIGRTVYVEACPTLLAALARAEELAKENDCRFKLAQDVRRDVLREKGKRGAAATWKTK